MTNKQIYNRLQDIVQIFEKKCSDTFEQETPQGRSLYLSLKTLLEEIEDSLDIQDGLPMNIEDLFEEDDSIIEEEADKDEAVDDFFDSLIGLDNEDD